MYQNTVWECSTVARVFVALGTQILTLFKGAAALSWLCVLKPAALSSPSLTVSLYRGKLLLSTKCASCIKPPVVMNWKEKLPYVTDFRNVYEQFDNTVMWRLHTPPMTP